MHELKKKIFSNGFTLIRTSLRKNLAAGAVRTSLRKNLVRAQHGFTLIKTSLRENFAANAVKTSLRENFVNVNKGFTLIELLVVIMTMTLIFTVGFANYRDFQRRKILENAVETVKGDLRFAQQQALASKKPAGCLSTEYLHAYIFRFVDRTMYEIVARCMPGPNDVVTKSASESDISTKHPGITIGLFTDVEFNVLGRGVDSAVTITLTQPSSGATNSIEITKGGEIK